MKKQTLKLTLITVASTCLFLVACSSDSNKKNTSKPNEEQAQSTNSITLKQFAKVESGMTYEEVKDILGADGDLFSETGEKGTSTYSVTYVWPGIKPQSLAEITFLDGKVRGMYQQRLQ